MDSGYESLIKCSKEFGTRAYVEQTQNLLFVQSFFPVNVLDKIWDLVESVSESFPT